MGRRNNKNVSFLTVMTKTTANTLLSTDLSERKEHSAERHELSLNSEAGRSDWLVPDRLTVTSA